MRCETFRMLAGTTSLKSSPHVALLQLDTRVQLAYESRAVESRSLMDPCRGQGNASCARVKLPCSTLGHSSRTGGLARVGSRRSRSWACIAVHLSTARMFSGTVDEPAHLAAGHAVAEHGAVHYDLQHPPLGANRGRARTLRARRALDRRAVGLRRRRGDSRQRARYVEALASARHGTIVFLALLAGRDVALGEGLSGEAGARSRRCCS